VELGRPMPPIPRVLTLPNVLSALRLIGVPVFVWLLLTERDGWAVALLFVSGFTDYLDGLLARRWNQVSRLGQLLDPAADRLYILSTLLGLAYRGVIPWWLTGLLIGRDAVLALTLPVLRHYGYGPLPVHFLGKAATFNLLCAFPFLLLGQVGGAVGAIALGLGWALASWGAALYGWAGWLYLRQVGQVVALARAEDRAEATLQRGHREPQPAPAPTAARDHEKGSPA
jgi:cardiolipin synthase (CMP-forming)